MNRSFGHEASRLFNLAARALGWIPDDFWNATPSEFFDVICDPHLEDTLMDQDTISRLLEQDKHGR